MFFEKTVMYHRAARGCLISHTSVGTEKGQIDANNIMEMPVHVIKLFVYILRYGKLIIRHMFRERFNSSRHCFYLATKVPNSQMTVRKPRC